MRKITLLLSFLPFCISAQQISEPFGQEYIFESTGCLDNVQRAEIQNQIAANISWLQSTGKIAQNYSQSQVLFDWPMRLRAGVNEYGYHSISGQVDQNPAYPNQVLDYNCGSRTYDTQAGYNHAGTDFFTWPFGFNKMDSSDVEIIAAAAGTIVYKQDGQYDRSCAFNSNQWNAVYVQHSDGSVAWYGHMKNGSLTNKTVGQTVAVGEYLGVVGSSGNSSGPHLHFEVYDSGNNLIDPFAGSCNSMNSSSWWINQRPYVDGAINHIVTNDAPPVFSVCPNDDIKNERNYFTDTDTIYLMLYFRFLSVGDNVLYTIYRPDNSVWGSWTYTHTGQNYNAAWYYYWMIAGSGEQQGAWRYEAVYNNQVYSTLFYLGTTGIASQHEPEFSSTVFYDANASDIQVLLQHSNLNLPNRNYEIQFYDLTGRIVQHSNLNSTVNHISAEPFASGIYTYSILENGIPMRSGKLMVKE